MTLWRHELRLFLRQRMALPALVLTLILAMASVAAGLGEIARQEAAIARIPALQREDVGAIAEFVLRKGDAGDAAYYTPHATWDPPSPLAFAAIGQRDVAPYMLRVRALGVEGQIYDGELYNAELALPGRFDWAFVLTYLTPLILVALLHDLVSGERESGRITLLRAMARSERALWLRRIGLRVGLVYAALILPLIVGAVLSGAGSWDLARMMAHALGYCLFWTGVMLAIGAAGWSSVANAATGAAMWFGTTLVLPALANLAVNAAIPVRQGVELTLAQREAVHGGWDRPKDATMAAFFRTHPEWSGTRPVGLAFHWKWYFAFQQLGDESVAGQSRAYRAALIDRDRWTRRLGWVLPTVGIQTATHRIARTDLTAQIAYQDRIRAYHAAIRRFFYPYLFNDVPFTRADFDRIPKWQPGG
ncbi:ABC transporter permease [Sphingomonas sp. FW199]|uniref:ABC transporter permease n=1 Tax=Sphingomonas sp. FW199 TaxID=3400217 RepID=UPI003CEA6460